MSINILFILKR